MSSLLAKAKEITGWTDPDLALVVGMPRSTVQACIAGRRVESLDATQTKALLDALRLHRDKLVAGVEEIELLS